MKQTVSSSKQPGIRSHSGKTKEVDMPDVDMLMGDFIAGDAYEGTAMELPASTYIGSVDTFNEDFRGPRFFCEGYLVDRDEKPRILPPRDPTRSPRRGPSSDEPSSVLDLLLVDRTGPIKKNSMGIMCGSFLSLDGVC